LHFEYSNTDNIVIGLMARQAAAGIVSLLKREVFGPLRITSSTMPKGFGMPKPFVTAVYDAQGRCSRVSGP
jgi:D-alanyl-D-alanine carboxypeptidase